MTGFSLIIAFVIAVVGMVVAISKFKIHPFISIMSAALLLGLFAGIPLVNVTIDGKTTQGIANVIGAGFSGAFTSIGIVIILGALIGTILEATGAAFKLADMVIKIVSAKRPVLGIQLMGWVVSIPVFCDSGFVILDPIRKALVRRTRVSGVAMTVALSSGLYASHVFIPPTPGPIAAANTLGAGHNLLLVMALGVLVSIPALAGALVYANYIGKRIKSSEDISNDGVQKSYEEIAAGYGKLPGGFISLAPIVIPILLMALGSIASFAKWQGTLFTASAFLGTPVIALAVGVVFAAIQLAQAGKSAKFYELTNETLKTVGPILFITAAGGVLGRVISVSGMVAYITENSTLLASAGIFFPFLLSAILKSAQGSSTVALTTTAGIVAPLLGGLGLDTPERTALTVIAIGAGAMTVSHANDSYFWVVTNFGALKTEQGYKTQTVVTLVEGVCAMAGVFVLSLFL
ncbi:MAG: GntP family permease [Spirochaetaceae bacterium]|jgi:GntP family gluconate:H+ symporter|nr:GntP family permease [Spirochaetaceae bacterium]